MKKTLIIFVLLISQLKLICGQVLDKNYVDNWIISTFETLPLIDSSSMYILNGGPFKPSEIDESLKKYKREDLIYVNFIDKKTIDTLNFIPRTSIVLLITEGKQTKKSIESDLKKAKRRFVKRDLYTTADIDTTLKEPVLLIDGNQIFHKDCYKKINSLKNSKILGINIIERPVSKIIYGSNGVNGLIIIKTKK
jgi:hypothetical protein